MQNNNKPTALPTLFCMMSGVRLSQLPNDVKLVDAGEGGTVGLGVISPGEI
jgi:hypothetical protein